MRPVVGHSISAYCPAAWIYHQLTFLEEFGRYWSRRNIKEE